MHWLQKMALLLSCLHPLILLESKNIFFLKVLLACVTNIHLLKYTPLLHAYLQFYFDGVQFYVFHLNMHGCFTYKILN
jgi:hypothetical protein